MFPQFGRAAPVNFLRASSEGWHIGLKWMYPANVLDWTSQWMAQWADILVEIIARHFARRGFHIVPWQFRIGLHTIYGRFLIGLPRVGRRFCMDPPKWYIQFNMVLLQVYHTINSHNIYKVWELWWPLIAVMQEIEYCISEKSNVC